MDDDTFPGWKISPGVTYKDLENQSVLNQLVKEVKALNKDFLTQHIKDAAYRFYRSRCEASSNERRRMLGEEKKSKRMHERIKRKYNERRATIDKGVYKNETEKEDWLKVMTIDLMSSEESELDGEDEVIMVHPLTWLSDKVVCFKETLDLETKKSKKPQARRQMKPCVTGVPFTRPPPSGLPSWVLRK